MIRFTVSISICGAQQSRAHNHAQSLRFTTVQVLKDSSGIDQPQYGQSWFRELRAQRQGSSLSSSSLSSLSSEANQVRSLNQWSQGSVSRSKDHVASRGSSQKDQCQRAHRHTQYSDHYLIDIASSLKIGFQASFDSACLHFTPFLRFAFHSSPVIVIVKTHSDI